MPDLPLLLVLIVAVALVFDFTNGAHDSANAIATVVSTKVLSPRTAVLMAAGHNLIGAMLGDEDDTTLGEGLGNPDMLNGSFWGLCSEPSAGTLSPGTRGFRLLPHTR